MSRDAAGTKVTVAAVTENAVLKGRRRTPLQQGATIAPHPTKEEIEKLLEVAPQYGIEIRLSKTDRIWSVIG